MATTSATYIVWFPDRHMPILDDDRRSDLVVRGFETDGGVYPSLGAFHFFLKIRPGIEYVCRGSKKVV